MRLWGEEHGHDRKISRSGPGNPLCGPDISQFLIAAFTFTLN